MSFEKLTERLLDVKDDIECLEEAGAYFTKPGRSYLDVSSLSGEHYATIPLSHDLICRAIEEERIRLFREQSHLRETIKASV